MFKPFTMKSVLIRIERGGVLSVFTTRPDVCFKLENNTCVIGALGRRHHNQRVASCPVTPPTMTSHTPTDAKDAPGINIRVDMAMAPTGPSRTASFLSFLERAVSATGPVHGSNLLDGLTMILDIGDGVAMNTQHLSPNDPAITGAWLSPFLTFTKAAVDKRAVAVPDPYFIDSRG